MFSYINDIEYILFPRSSLFQHFNNKSVIKYLLFSSLADGWNEWRKLPSPSPAEGGNSKEPLNLVVLLFIHFCLSYDPPLTSYHYSLLCMLNSAPYVTHTQYTFYDSFMRKDIRSICKVLKCGNGKFTTLLLID